MWTKVYQSTEFSKIWEGTVNYTKAYTGAGVYQGSVENNKNYTKAYAGLADYVKAYRVAITYTGTVNYTKAYVATFQGTVTYAGIHDFAGDINYLKNYFHLLLISSITPYMALLTFIQVIHQCCIHLIKRLI